MYLACCIAVISTVTSAQQTFQYPSGSTTIASAVVQSVPESTDIRSTTLSIDVQNAPLRTVLDEITKQSGVPILYSRDVVPVDRKTSVRGSSITLGEAIEQALAGTGLEGRVTGKKIAIGRPMAGFTVRAQGTIVGRVLHAKTRQPVASATVTVGSNTQGVSTQADGSFRLPAVPGNVTIRVRAVGFEQLAKSVRVADGESATIELLLAPVASVLDEVIVTGTVVATARKEIPTPITVITAQEIEKRGITRIEQFFRGEVPGVLALEQGSDVYIGGLPEDRKQTFGSAVSSKVYTRGASGFGADPRGTATPLKTYVDGVEILDPAYLGTIDLASVERIEIITGPQASTIYGSGAMGGVMQIFTKRGSATGHTQVTLTLKQGFLQNNQTDGLTPKSDHALSMVGGSGPEFSYSGTLSYNYSGQWRPGLWMRSIGATVGLTHTRGKFTASGSFSLTNGKNGSASSLYNGRGSPYYLENWERGLYWENYSTSALFTPRQVASSQGQTASMTLNYQQSGQWLHSFTVGRNQTKFALEPTGPRWYDPLDSLWYTGSSTGERTTVSYNLSGNLNPNGRFSSAITAGFNGSVGSQLVVSGCTASKDAVTYVNLCVPEYQSYTTVSKGLDDQSWGEFLSWRIGLFRQIYFTLGLRAEQNPAYGRNVKVDWTPTNGIAYTLERDAFTVKFLGSYGRATRAPTPDMRKFVEETYTYFTPNTIVTQIAAPLLKPEYSRGPQFGMELYYGSRGSLTINRYDQKVTDLIQDVRADSVEILWQGATEPSWYGQRQWQNIGKIRSQGWEGTASTNIAMLSFKGTFSWNDSRVLAVNTSSSNAYAFKAGQRLQYTPTHTGSIIVGYAHGGTSVTVSTSFIGQSLYNGGDDRLNFDLQYMRIKTYVLRRNRHQLQMVRTAYAKSDVSVLHRITPSINLTANIVNLGNQFNSDVAWYSPSLGRQSTIGLSIRNPLAR